MSIIKQIPELSEGGYWYVVEAVVETEDFGGQQLTVPIEGAAWCATYAEIDGEMYAVVRTTKPVDIDVVDVDVVSVLTAAEFQGRQATTAKHAWRVEGQ